MKKYALTIYAVLVLFIIFVPVIHWAMNPEMTQMQVIIEYWWLYLFAILITIITLRYYTK